MRIRSLEISGFKSFADRVVLGFDRGVSAIVGPNGCGKSNVVDAIRWVMGEQNPRKLRGRLMEDLIFAGTQSKPQVGLAEVILTFDNSDGLAPPPYKEFSEIQLTRRLYRSGESDYLINKTPVRLRDVTDFFLDSGIGSRGYTIVEQGAIATIVSSRPQDRRFIFEEAAGIGKYRQRRAETERKLKATEQNLLRVRDITGELRRQINSLDRQASKANRYKKLAAEVRDLELVVAHEEFQVAGARLGELERELDASRAESVSLDARVASAESELEDERRSHLDRERALQAASEALYELRGEIQSLESQIQFERREREGLVRLVEERGAEIAEIEARVEAEEAELTRRDAELREQIEARAAAEGRLEALRARLVDLTTEGATLGSRSQSLDERRAETEQRLRQNEEALEASVNEVETLRAEEESLATRLGASLAERDDLGRKIGELMRTREALETSLERAAAELDAVRERLQRADARLGALREAEERESRRVAQMLEALPDGARRAIRGTLSEVVRVEDGLEAAFEAVLEARLDAVLVDDAASALEVLDGLRKAAAGRAVVLPIRDGRDPEPVGIVPLGRPLLDSVHCDDAFRPLVRRLLGEVYVVDRLHDAVDRYGGSALPAVFVTPSGELLERSGALAGGQAAPAGALSRAGEIRRLGEERAQLGAQLGALETQVAGDRTRHVDLGIEIENARNRLHTAEIVVANLEKDLERARERTKDASVISEEQRAGKRRLLGEMQHGQELLEELERRLAEIRTEREGAERDRDLLLRALDERARELERLEAQVVEARVALAERTTRRDQLKENSDRCQAQVTETLSWITRREGEVATATERAASLESSSREASQRLDALLEREEERRAEQERLRSGYDAGQGRVTALEESVRGAARDRDAARERLSSAELAAQEVRMRCDALRDRIQERYGVDLVGYRLAERIDGDPAAREAELKRLRSALDSLGDVNLGSIEEYEEVSERFRYLEEQRVDLETSIERLRNAIARINRTSRARFRETFELVDAKFQEVFPRMFHGGKAHLSLTEEEDVLEAGIEITAMPPGKKLQNVNLLSGGEKALTALSLLMAVFAVKPAPFFLLDEVDAALDDANVARYDDLVREMSVQSQFLIITHNKSSIGAADTLYGVTMEEPGCSKLVTVDLRES